MTPALHAASCPVTVAGLVAQACSNRHRHQTAGPWESSEAGSSRRPSRAANRRGLALIFSVLGICLAPASRVNEEKSAARRGSQPARSRSIWRRARHRPGRGFTAASVGVCHAA